MARPKGTKKEPRVDYHRRVLPEWVELLDKRLLELKEQNKIFYENYKKSIYK